LEFATEWLKLLQQIAPGANCTIQLHWELMSQLTSGGKHESYLKHARQFLRYPRISEGHYQPAVQTCVHKVYSTLGAERCGKFIKNDIRGFLKADWIEAAWSLCRVPEHFSTRKKIEKLHSQVSHDLVSFSPAMQRDALILAARSCEWRGEIDGMIGRLSKAAQLETDSEELQYWLSRAALQKCIHGSVDGDEYRVTPKNQKEKRIDAAWELYLHANRESARNVLPLIDCVLEKPEEEMILHLLKRALSISFGDAPNNIEETAKICTAIQDKVQKEIPFTRLNLAFKSLLIDRDYPTAKDQLEKKGMAELIQSREPLSVARIMNGDFPGNDLLSLVDLVKTFSKQCLEAIPELTQVKELIELLPGLLSGKSKQVQRLHSFYPLPTSPAWLKWLFYRLCVIFLPAESIIHAMEQVSVTEPAVAKDLYFWIKEGAPVSVMSHSKITQIEQIIQIEEEGESQRPRPGKPRLGATPEKLILSSQEIASRYNQFRIQLAERKIVDAVKSIHKIFIDLNSMDPMNKEF
jgi:hypothetical protein